VRCRGDDLDIAHEDGRVAQDLQAYLFHGAGPWKDRSAYLGDVASCL
jgi:hypothetical protein